MADIVRQHAEAAAVGAAAHGHGHGHGHAHEHGHGHPPYLQHHFDTPVQQFDATKLGMWLFLATEILLFAGLFCAYAIYRANHPEIFDIGHLALDKWMGALNTVILLASSFTMACAVTAAQRGSRFWMVLLLSLTLAGGAGFMVVKFFEYRAKIEHGLLWGHRYSPHDEAAHGHADSHGHEAGAHTATPAVAVAAPAAAAPAATAPAVAGASAGAAPVDAWAFQPAASPPSGVRLPAEAYDADHEHPNFAGTSIRNVHIFFGIYFIMTGLHGIHVLAGMAVIGWLIWRAQRGDFSSEYFTPVDLGGLYWHLVDLIWIYLFPLLYLIQ